MKPATTLSMLVLLMITAGHVIRLVAQWPVSIDGMSVPIWISGVVAVVLGALVIFTFIEQKG